MGAVVTTKHADDGMPAIATTMLTTATSPPRRHHQREPHGQRPDVDRQPGWQLLAKHARRLHRFVPRQNDPVETHAVVVPRPRLHLVNLIDPRPTRSTGRTRRRSAAPGRTGRYCGRRIPMLGRYAEARHDDAPRSTGRGRSCAGP